VSVAASVTVNRLQAVPRSAAQARVITAALDLFGEHGVSGTSLQMIADAVGVTKAAIYHQFKAKDEIVMAVAEVDLLQLQDALDVAEAETSGPREREVLVKLVIDLAVERRQIVSALQRDPVIVRFLAKHEPFLHLMDRLFTVLTGGDPGAEARVRAAMFSAAIGGAVTHPLVMDLGDETLRHQLLHLSRSLLDLPDL
jgi:AcrR family transcriptional regulator